MRRSLSARPRRALLLASCVSAIAGAAACEDTPTDVVSSGTIGGIPFTVISGTVKQAVADGPIVWGKELLVSIVKCRFFRKGR
jgi:hypothetical protein